MVFIPPSQPPPHHFYPTAVPQPGPAANASLPGRFTPPTKFRRRDYSKARWHALLATNDEILHLSFSRQSIIDKGENMVTEADILLLKSRINELEDHVKFLYRRLNIEYADPNADPALAPQVQDALRRGNKIEAIKIYRELTGVGLAESKQAIDRAEQFIK